MTIHTKPLTLFYLRYCCRAPTSSFIRAWGRLLGSLDLALPGYHNRLEVVDRELAFLDRDAQKKLEAFEKARTVSYGRMGRK